MIIFDQLRISDNGKKMYINVHVNKADYFDNIYLDSITIMTADKVSETDPFMPTKNFIYHESFDENQKEAALVLKPVDFMKMWEENVEDMMFPPADMSNTLFFVYIKAKGVPDACTPCRLDEEVTLGVTFDENLLYQRVMDYTKEVIGSCHIPVGFTDFILLWNAFKASVETEHYVPAIKYYNMLFGKEEGSASVPIIATKGCNCNG